MLTKIDNCEIKVGEALKWPVFDDEGRLLLNEGNIVPSEKILAAILEHGVYRKTTVDDLEEVGSKTENQKDPFALLKECSDYMESLFNAIEAKDPSVEQRVQQLVKGLIKLIHHHPDACLGAIHLCHEGPYTLWHPLSVAILSELVAKRLKIPDAERFAILATAITSNIGMRNLQEVLQAQSDPLDEKQRKHLNAHPAKSAEMLMDTGITNVAWIKAVFQHHERIDGSGYPEGISGSEIGRPAKLVAVADRYAAMVRGRIYRKAIHGKDTLRELLVENGKFYDQELSLMMISELGIYPPGSIVQLRDGEVGMVVNRGKKNNEVPLVAAFIGSRGAVMEKPVLRNTLVTSYQVRDKFELEGELPFSLLELWSAVFATNEQISAA